MKNTKEMNVTQDYSKFSFLDVNRNVNPTKPEAKRLRKSMQKYGYLPSFPVMVRENGGGKLHIIDGQHRVYFASELGLPVYYVVDNAKIDIAELNDTQSTWRLSDHIARWQRAGYEDYQEVIDFSSKYNIPVGMSAGLLAGTATGGNVLGSIRRGDYRVKTRDLAHSVAKTYNDIIHIDRSVKKYPFLLAIYACHFVDYFEPNRLVETCVSNPNMITNYGNRDGFLEMIQEIYNHRRRTKVPLAFDAKQAVEKRNVINKNK